jgi:putative ABC transport system permease protein
MQIADVPAKQRQIKLPMSQAVKISLRNVTLRLGRAIITAAGIVLGIAFLMSVWTGSIVAQAVQEKGLDEATLAATQARQTWLIVMALLVCGLGITNSMLMSVTERFREIGTMKCLGALDEFIVRLFVIESAFLGLFGSLAGAILGALVMLVFAGIKQGWYIAVKISWAGLGAYFLYSVLIGVVLSLLAAIPPAVRAAKLPPAAALRVEI